MVFKMLFFCSLKKDGKNNTFILRIQIQHKEFRKLYTSLPKKRDKSFLATSLFEKKLYINNKPDKISHSAWMAV